MNVSKGLVLCFFLFSSVCVTAQVRFPLANNELRQNLQKVISGFSNEMDDLKSDTLIDNPQTIEFATRLDFPMSVSNRITEFKSVKPMYSWSAELISTETFEEAEKKYKWLFNQLKVMTINGGRGYSYSMSGDYDRPDESKKFFGSVFTLTPRASDMPRVRVEAAMRYEFPEWKVFVMVYEKEREDDDRGDVYGN